MTQSQGEAGDSAAHAYKPGRAAESPHGRLSPGAPHHGRRAGPAQAGWVVVGELHRTASVLRLHHFLGRAVSGRPALQEDNSSTTIVLLPSVIQQELAA